MRCELQYGDCVIEYDIVEDNVHIVDSHYITDEADMYEILDGIREQASEYGLEYDRSNESWITEWKTHNYLYEIGFYCERTGSVDLNEYESWWVLLLYIIISFFCLNYKFKVLIN